MEYTKKISSIIEEIEKKLLAVYSDPILRTQYAWWIVQAITQQDQASLIAAGAILFSDAQQQKLDQWLDRMVNEHMPLQYLLGSVPFGDVDILVEPPVLIPRPETEEWVLNLIDQLKPLVNEHLAIADLCSGSGCIAIALAKALPKSHIYAIDLSEKAIELGKKNAQHNHITNVTFIHSDLFDEVENATLFDLIVSNPPYISFAQFEELDTSVTTWEDPQALVANDDGYAILRAIIEQAPDYTRQNPIMKKNNIPQLVLEIDYTQGHKIADFMHASDYIDINVLKDLEGKDRVVVGRIGNVVTPFMAE